MAPPADAPYPMSLVQCKVSCGVRGPNQLGPLGVREVGSGRRGERGHGSASMPPKDAGKGAKGKAPPPAATGKISAPKLRTPADDKEYAAAVGMVAAKAPPIYNPNDHAPPVCMGGFWDHPGRRPQCRPALPVLQGKDPHAGARPPAGSGGGGGGAAKGKDAKGAKGKDAAKKKK